MPTIDATGEASSSAGHVSPGGSHEVPGREDINASRSAGDFSRCGATAGQWVACIEWRDLRTRDSACTWRRLTRKLCSEHFGGAARVRGGGPTRP